MTDAGTGLRAGQIAAWGDKPRHGDVFHVRQQCEAAANVLARLLGRRHQDPDRLARHDVLSLAGPPLEERRALFDFIVAPHRIRPLRVALQRQRDDVLGFARVLNDKLATIAQRPSVPRYWVRQVCRLHRKKPTSTAFWQRWNELHARLGRGFVAFVADVRAAMDDTPRSSSMVENLNSRPRRYFFRCRHLGAAYLSLLQFFLNHRVFMRSRRAERVGKTSKELLTGQAHAHWLELLGFQRLAIAGRSPRRAGSSPSQFDRTRLETAGLRGPLALACVARKRSKLNHAVTTIVATVA